MHPWLIVIGNSLYSSVIITDTLLQLLLSYAYASHSMHTFLIKARDAVFIKNRKWNAIYFGCNCGNEKIWRNTGNGLYVMENILKMNLLRWNKAATTRSSFRRNVTFHLTYIEFHRTDSINMPGGVDQYPSVSNQGAQKLILDRLSFFAIAMAIKFWFHRLCYCDSPARNVKRAVRMPSLLPNQYPTCHYHNENHA